MKNIIKIITSLLIVFLFTSCSSKPTHLVLEIKSSSSLNPDINGVPSPLMLTFYELESAEKFMKYDYWTLSKNAGENLSEDLVSQAKHIITPQQMHTYKILFEDRTKFLGVVGKFRNIKKELAWKYVINLEKGVYNFSELKIDEFDIKRVE